MIEISEGKVGDRLAQQRMEEIRSEGPRRYASRVPPGYEDSAKPGDRAYGDLILWFEIIEKATDTGKPVLLVTDDRKEDWWQKTSGQAFEPHAELVDEMHREAGVLLHMFLPLEFVGWAGEKLEREISDEAAKEIE